MQVIVVLISLNTKILITFVTCIDNLLEFQIYDILIMGYDPKSRESKNKLFVKLLTTKSCPNYPINKEYISIINLMIITSPRLKVCIKKGEVHFI